MIILITAPVINLGGWWLSGGVLYCNPKPSSISPHSRLYRRLSDSNTAAKEIKKAVRQSVYENLGSRTTGGWFHSFLSNQTIFK